MNYELRISISSQDLNQIVGGGLSVGIAKSVGGSQGPAVAWIAFRPLSSNSVTFEDRYSVYATFSPPQPGAVIQVMSEEQGQLGGVYTFRNNFFQSGSGGPGNALTIQNEQQGNLGFGLSQRATVNGAPSGGPTNVDSLPTGQRGSFEPKNTLQVFLAQQVRNGTILSQVPFNALRVNVSSGPVNIRFENGQFVLA